VSEIRTTSHTSSERINSPTIFNTQTLTMNRKNKNGRRMNTQIYLFIKEKKKINGGKLNAEQV